MESMPRQPDQPERHPRLVELQPPLAPRDRDGLTAVELLEAGRPQLEQLLVAMAPDIRAGRWGAILGDDVSGRIPTLILRYVIARVYAEQGKETPKTYFVAMGKVFSTLYDEAQEGYHRVTDIKEYLASGERPQRVLFVTDNIAVGGSIDTVLEALDDIGVPSDVASVQERQSLVEQMSGHAPYSPEDAQAVVEKIAAQGRIHSEEDRARYLDAWTHGTGHGERDPGAKYYGVDNPINGYITQPFHLSTETRAQKRAAVGVEKYGGPVTEGTRQHEIRALHGGKLVDEENKPIRDDRVPPNPDATELREAASKMADELYKKVFAPKP